jgi:hypothetical protein
MGPVSRKLIADRLMVVSDLAILTLLAHGPISATVFGMACLVFLAFGERPERPVDAEAGA